MKFFDYLSSLGFSKKESEIYLALYRLGTQPASIVAKYVNMERTYVYKALVDFSVKHVVATTEKNGVKHFFIPDIALLKKYVSQEEDRYRRMGAEFSAIEAELASYRANTESRIPKITIHEGSEGIRHLYDEIYDEIVANGYISCKMFASNTISSQSGKADTVARYADDFFSKLSDRGIHIDTPIIQLEVQNPKGTVR